MHLEDEQRLLTALERIAYALDPHNLYETEVLGPQREEALRKRIEQTQARNKAIEEAKMTALKALMDKA